MNEFRDKGGRSPHSVQDSTLLHTFRLKPRRPRHLRTTRGGLPLHFRRGYEGRGRRNQFIHSLPGRRTERDEYTLSVPCRRPPRVLFWARGSEPNPDPDPYFPVWEIPKVFPIERRRDQRRERRRVVLF